MMFIPFYFRDPLYEQSFLFWRIKIILFNDFITSILWYTFGWALVTTPLEILREIPTCVTTLKPEVTEFKIREKMDIPREWNFYFMAQNWPDNVTLPKWSTLYEENLIRSYQFFVLVFANFVFWPFSDRSHDF
jgi:hypothetical protein